MKDNFKEKKSCRKTLPRRPNVLIIGIQTPSNQKAQLILHEEEIIFCICAVHYIGSILVVYIVYIVYCDLPEVVDTRQSLHNDSGKLSMPASDQGQRVETCCAKRRKKRY